MWHNMQYGHGSGSDMMYGGGGWIGFAMHSLTWILVLVAIVAVIVWVLRSISSAEPRGNGQGSGASALEILDERYARGEIEREDYLARKKDLSG